jgi:hypothetical protein
MLKLHITAWLESVFRPLIRNNKYDMLAARTVKCAELAAATRERNLVEMSSHSVSPLYVTVCTESHDMRALHAAEVVRGVAMLAWPYCSVRPPAIFIPAGHTSTLI